MGDDVGITDRQRRAATDRLETVVEAIAEDRQIPYRSVEFGPNGGELGFNVRRGSLMVEYQTRVNVLDETPALGSATGGLVDISRHVPLREAGEVYARLEEAVVDLVATTVPSVPSPEALDAVMVWPVTDEAGLYLVGFDVTTKKFIYAGAFRIPLSAME